MVAMTEISLVGLMDNSEDEEMDAGMAAWKVSKMVDKSDAWKVD